jgi:hypothetical protein
MKDGNRQTSPGEVISPLVHTHGKSETTQPGEVLGTMTQETPTRQKDSSDDSIRERLSSPPKDNKEITIGPTTRSGPDITVTQT